MALNVSSLASRIETEISTAFNTPVNDYMIKYATAMAKAIIAEIQANGETHVTYNDGQYQDSTHINVDQSRTATGTIL